jgi:hypothetical protein
MNAATRAPFSHAVPRNGTQTDSKLESAVDATTSRSAGVGASRSEQRAFATREVHVLDTESSPVLTSSPHHGTSTPLNLPAASPSPELEQIARESLRSDKSLVQVLGTLAVVLSSPTRARSFETMKQQWILLRHVAQTESGSDRNDDAERVSPVSGSSTSAEASHGKPGIRLESLTACLHAQATLSPALWLVSINSGATRILTAKNATNVLPPALAKEPRRDSDDKNACEVHRKFCALASVLIADLSGTARAHNEQKLEYADDVESALQTDLELLEYLWDRWTTDDGATAKYPEESQRRRADSSPMGHLLTNRIQQTWSEAAARALRGTDLDKMLDLLEMLDWAWLCSVDIDAACAVVHLAHSIGICSTERRREARRDAPGEVDARAMECLGQWLVSVLELHAAFAGGFDALLTCLGRAYVSLLWTTVKGTALVNGCTKKTLTSADWTLLTRPVVIHVFGACWRALTTRGARIHSVCLYTQCCEVLGALCILVCASGTVQHVIWREFGRCVHAESVSVLVHALATGACLCVLRAPGAAHAATALFLQLLETPWAYRVLESASRLLAGEMFPVPASTLLASGEAERLPALSSLPESLSGESYRQPFSFASGGTAAPATEALGRQHANIEASCGTRPSVVANSTETDEMLIEAAALGAMHCLLMTLAQGSIFEKADGFAFASALIIRVSESAAQWAEKSPFFTMELVAALHRLVRVSHCVSQFDDGALTLLVEVATRALLQRFGDVSSTGISTGAGNELMLCGTGSRAIPTSSVRATIARFVPSNDSTGTLAHRIQSDDYRASANASLAAETGAMTVRSLDAAPDVRAQSTPEAGSIADMAAFWEQVAHRFIESVLDYVERTSPQSFGDGPEILSFLERVGPLTRVPERLRMLALRERLAQPFFGLETWVDRLQYVLTVYLRDESRQAVRLRAVRFFRDTFTVWKGLYADLFVTEVVQPVLLGAWKELHQSAQSRPSTPSEYGLDAELTEELVHTVAVALSAPMSLAVFERFARELLDLGDEVLTTLLAALETYLREHEAPRASVLFALLTDHCLEWRTAHAGSLGENDAPGGHAQSRRHLLAFCGFICRLSKDLPHSPFLQLDGKTLPCPVRLGDVPDARAVSGDGERSAYSLPPGIAVDTASSGVWCRTERTRGASVSARTGEALERHADGSDAPAPATGESSAPADQPSVKPTIPAHTDVFGAGVLVPVAAWYHHLLGRLLHSTMDDAAYATAAPPAVDGTAEAFQPPELESIMACLVHLVTDPGFGPIALVPALQTYDLLGQWLERSRKLATDKSGSYLSLAARHLALEVLAAITLRELARSAPMSWAQHIEHLLDMVIAELYWLVAEAERLPLYPPMLDFTLRLLVQGWCMAKDREPTVALQSITAAYLVALQVFAGRLVAVSGERPRTCVEHARHLADCVNEAAAILESLHGVALCFRELVPSAQATAPETGSFVCSDVAMPAALSPRVRYADGVQSAGADPESGSGPADVGLLAAFETASIGVDGGVVAGLATRRNATYAHIAFSIVITLVPLFAPTGASLQGASPAVAQSQGAQLRRLAMSAWCNWASLVHDVTVLRPYLEALEERCRKHGCTLFAAVAAEFTYCFGGVRLVDRGPSTLLDKALQQAPLVASWALAGTDALPVVINAYRNGYELTLAIRRVTGSSRMQLRLHEPPWTWYPERRYATESSSARAATFAEAPRRVQVEGTAAASTDRSSVRLPFAAEQPAPSSSSSLSSSVVVGGGGVAVVDNAIPTEKSPNGPELVDSAVEKKLDAHLRGVLAQFMHRQPLEAWRRLVLDRQVWQVLDRMPPEDIHRIGLMYVGTGQQTESEILANVAGDSQYDDFCTNLGVFLRLTDHWMFGYTGGLDYSERQADGAFALYYRDAATQLIFHTTTLMPAELGTEGARLATDPANSVPEPAGTPTNPAVRFAAATRGSSSERKSLIRKKRHVGNDHVKIFWCARRTEARIAATPDVLPGAFNSVHFTIAPLSTRDGNTNEAAGGTESSLFLAEAHWHRSGMPRSGPWRVPGPCMVCGTGAAAFLLRLAAIHADTLCGCRAIAGYRSSMATSSVSSAPAHGSTIPLASAAGLAIGSEEEPWLRRLSYMQHQIERLSGESLPPGTG